MEAVENKLSHFALLIGVNSDSERPLKGCVRDVREIAKFVNNSLSRVHMQLFTADTSITRSDTPETLATYANVKAGFQNILSIAAPGDYVYVHYSGHGVRMEASSEFSNRTTGDLALNVLEDSSQEITRPFPGVELAHVLDDMVTQGLTVTLVLDCCFSGSIVRHHSVSEYSSVRYREYTREAYTTWFPFLDDNEGKTENIERPNDRGRRKATMLPNWLVNPKGYTVITACGPHEVASELSFGTAISGYRHGALSYFLLRAMARLGGLGGRHAHIYPYLCSMFRQFRPTQNPMWYGNKDLYFFGNATFSTELTGAPFSTTWAGARLRLEGGQAHGVCEGDQFAVYTIDSGRPLVTGTIRNVKPLTSDIELFNPEVIQNEKGCIAKALTHLSLRGYPIQLDQGGLYSEEWATALEERNYLAFEDKDHPFALHVYPKGNGSGYIIQDRYDRETECSTDKLGNNILAMSPSRVLDIVEHLAKFQLMRDMTNMSQEKPFGGRYRVMLLNEAGQSFQAGDIVNVKEQELLHLVVENEGKMDLYVHVFNLDSLGQVENILKASYVVISPPNLDDGFTGEWVKKLQTHVPPGFIQQGIANCEDIIKIFITSQPTSFAPLEMQQLHDSNDSRVVELPDREHTPYTGKEDWVALDFRIRTHK